MPVHVRSLIVTAVAAAIFAGSRSTRACILEFRSADAQVASSSLVVVAKITHITVPPIPPEAAALYPQGLARPSIATAAVVKILKGPPDMTTLKISSGPLRSCSPFPVHAEFVKDRTCVFILSDEANGVYQLRWLGSVRELSDLAAVEDSVARCTRWRSEYLHRVGTQTPDIYHAAEKLDAQLVAAAKTWPAISPDSLAPADILHSTTEQGPLKTAADAVFALFKDSDPAVVQTALAFDFGRSAPWSRQVVWEQASTRYVETHTRQVAALQQAEWLRLLRLAGGTATQLDTYIARIAKYDPTPQLSFPNAPPPTPYVLLRGESLTTDFLLRSQDFDRGLLYYAYGGQPFPLETLDPERVKDILPAMCLSSNEHLKWAASRAIEQIPGNRFVDLLVDQFTAGSNDFLQNIQTSALQDARLSLILDYAQAHLPAARQAMFWKRLAAAECFSPACIDRARAASGAPGPAGGDPKERAQYQAALADYLSAAKAYIKESQSLFEAPAAQPKP